LLFVYVLFLTQAESKLFHYFCGTNL
jgi:hypothetical protein